VLAWDFRTGARAPRRRRLLEGLEQVRNRRLAEHGQAQCSKPVGADPGLEVLELGLRHAVGHSRKDGLSQFVYHNMLDQATLRRHNGLRNSSSCLCHWFGRFDSVIENRKQEGRGLPFSAAAKQRGFPNAMHRIWRPLASLAHNPMLHPKPRTKQRHHLVICPRAVGAEPGKKSRFCLKTHIFSRNSGQPQEGLTLLPSSGTTAAPHATSPGQVSPDVRPGIQRILYDTTGDASKVRQLDLRQGSPRDRLRIVASNRTNSCPGS